MKHWTTTINTALLGWLSVVPQAGAQRVTYPPEEFEARRQALCESVGRNGLVMMFGATMPNPGVRFRQDNDFYYMTGNEDLNAVLVMNATRCEGHLFLPSQTEREASRDGWNWLYEPDSASRHGLTAIHPLSYLQEFLGRRRTGGPQTLYVRLSERTEVDQSRGDIAIFTGRRFANPWGSYPSEDAWRVEMLDQRFPYYELEDVSPHIDALRVIKSSREIEVLRRNGWVSAEAHRRAIEVTAPGVYEYEIEAEATYVMLQQGAEGAGYPAIVGSGPNVTVWHYQDNSRMTENGDLVVMDYGASMGYLTIDITRTWPVSGRFDELQERAYRCVLEAQKAILSAMRPGATREETREVSRSIYEKWGFGDQDAGGAGHFVGMSVHDVGDDQTPFKPGMVIAVEPIIEIKEKNLHIRIEDTVLITDGQPEILTAHVPKEIDEILALVGRRRSTRAADRAGSAR